MKPASSALITLLMNTSDFRMADLLTVTLFDTTVLRLTNCDIDLTLDGNLFHAGSDRSTTYPTFQRGKTRCVVGMEVDTLEVTLNCGQTVLMGGITMTRAAMNGAFDGARIKLERVFMPAWGNTAAGSVVLFEGAVAGVDPASTGVKLTIKSELDKLNVSLPRNLFQPACGYIIYGAGCGLSQAAWTDAGTVASGSTTTSINSSLTGKDANYYRLGMMVFTSGQNAGSRRAVRSYASGVFGVGVPLPYAPAAGDAFTVTAGCDHTLGSNGCAKFLNKNRFRGFPFVPRPETTR